jgi:predicted CxxxxCH...CXXCH cytochrome family protein
MKVGFACTECHDQPSNVFTLGHVLLGDTTPGRSEVNFAGGMNPEGTWDTTAGTCATLYCHGDGQEDNGELSEDAATPTCGECHPYLESGRSAWRGMSGKHDDHLRLDGANCSWCHYQTMGNPDCSDGSDCITDTSLHVNRENEILFWPDLEPRMEWRPESMSCSAGGSDCHGARDWLGHPGGGHHDDGPPEELVTD